MDIIILDSAYKHGITEESIMHCLFHSNNDVVVSHPPTKRVVVGFDHHGNAIEIVAIEDEERDRLMVFHAMKIRKKYYHLMQEGSSL